MDDPKSSLGKWVKRRFTDMNRRNTSIQVVNMFKITRDRCDKPLSSREMQRRTLKKLRVADTVNNRPDTSDYTATQYAIISLWVSVLRV